MPSRKVLNPKQALAHLKSVYKLYQKTGDGAFTIAQYKKLNDNPEYYIDVYVKKLGGWNYCLHLLKIPQNNRSFHSFSLRKIGQHVKSVYKSFVKTQSRVKFSGRQKTPFRMADYSRINAQHKIQIPVAVVILRFGSWNKVLEHIGIPIGRTRNLSNDELIEHFQKVHKRFARKHKNAVFTKEMYDAYNVKEKISVSTKLIERRFGNWKTAKKLCEFR